MGKRKRAEIELSFVGQIPTDWLTADWHEKEPPKRRRRNILPEAYRRLSKSDKQQVRAAAKWIHQRVSHVDWGRKMPDADAGKPVPKPVNLKDHVLPHIWGNWRSGVRKLTLTAIIRHLVNDDTAYFTANSLGDETLLMIDIDCHACGTLEGATQFAEFLRQNCFPNLYYEVSTHGNGIQGFVVVDRKLWKDAEYKATLVDVEKWLRRVLRWTPFDVEDVELKGMPLVVSWGERKGQVKSVTFGSLAKMPRDWTRFGEWQSTTHMTAHELRKLPERFAVPEPEPEPEAEPKSEGQEPVRKGSVSGKLVDPEDRPQAGAARQGTAGAGQARGRKCVQGGRLSRGCASGARRAASLHAAHERRRLDAYEAGAEALGGGVQGGGHDQGVLLAPLQGDQGHAVGSGVPGVGG